MAVLLALVLAIPYAYILSAVASYAYFKQKYYFHQAVLRGYQPEEQK